MRGTGILNPFRVRPLLNAVIPLNSTFEHIVHFFNPFNHALDIMEIYTSDKNLIIELLFQANVKNKISKSNGRIVQWHLKPYEVKPIVKINYVAHQPGRLGGFICIKTNLSDKIILPVEILVLKRPGLYSNVDSLKFTNDDLLRSTDAQLTIPIYVINHGPGPLTITVSLSFEPHR